MIPTITTYLWRVHRNRDRLELEHQRRVALWLTIGIVFWIGVAIGIWILVLK